MASEMPMRDLPQMESPPPDYDNYGDSNLHIDTVDVDINSDEDTEIRRTNELLYTPSHSIRESRANIPCRPAAFAVFLLLTGIICLCLGFYTLSIEHGSSLAFFLVGGIAIIPGSYQTYLLVQTLRGIPGYQFGAMPRFGAR
jgi:Transmembrane proteins 230/134